MSKPYEHHGMHNTKLYKVWVNMTSRCYNNKLRNYNNYGGRGIKVCDEWHYSFIAFRDWALTNGYAEGLTIDRIDVNGDYEPSNCRWITNKEQQNNKRGNIFITYKGETHTLKQWSEITGIHPKTLKYRTEHWDIEDALTKDVRIHKRSAVNE